MARNSMIRHTPSQFGRAFFYLSETSYKLKNL
nr:MAG TPA: hypothetical protein [Caudoviricetes sp.]